MQDLCRGEVVILLSSVCAHYISIIRHDPSFSTPYIEAGTPYNEHMRWFYVAYNTVMCIAPVSGTYIWFRRFQFPWRRFVFVWVAISAFWIVFDTVSVARGWWSYNPACILGLTLFGLPLDEITLFIAVPLVSSILLCLLGMFVRGRVHVRTAKRILLVCAGVLLFCIAAQFHKERTIISALAALLTIACLYRSRFITYRLFWCWNAVIIGYYLVFNVTLTTLPVVTYNDAFMTGLRIGTVPIENFLYNVSMLNMFALAFLEGHSWYDRILFRARTKPTTSPKSIQPPQNQSV